MHKVGAHVGREPFRDSPRWQPLGRVIKVKSARRVQHNGYVIYDFGHGH